MRAGRLYPGERTIRIEDVPVPEPRGDQVLVRVSGAGVCHSDIHVLDGKFPEAIRPPVTMGHEIAGTVEALGEDASGIEPGEPVAIMVGWGCGHCEWCVSGREQLCPEGDEAGATVDGGFAQFVLVPHRRHVVPLGAVDPLQATPFGCAALSAYAAVRRAQPALSGASTLLVIGVGGLGQYGVQFGRLLTGATVVAVDALSERAARARELGAEHALAASPDTAGEILELTQGRGAQAVIDFVGTDESLALAARTVGRRGLIAVLGLAGGTLPFTFSSLAPEAALTTVVAGTVRDLQDVVRLAQSHPFPRRLQAYPLDAIADALGDLRNGRIESRAVIVPWP